MISLDSQDQIERVSSWRQPLPSIATRRPSSRSPFSARATLISPQGRELLVESALEANAAYVIMAHPDVVDLAEQPPSVNYSDEAGKQRHHFPDFLVRFKDETKIAVLVKPAAKAEKQNMKELVRRLAAQVPKAYADKFMLMTEEQITPDRVHDGKVIATARLHPVPEHDASLRDNLKGVRGSMTISALVSLSGLGGCGFRAVVRLVADGTLKRVGNGRISLNTVVQVATDGVASR